MLQPDSAFTLTPTEKRLVMMEERVGRLEELLCLFKESTVESLELTSKRLKDVDKNFQVIARLMHGGGK